MRATLTAAGLALAAALLAPAAEAKYGYFTIRDMREHCLEFQASREEYKGRELDMLSVGICLGYISSMVTMLSWNCSERKEHPGERRPVLAAAIYDLKPTEAIGIFLRWTEKNRRRMDEELTMASLAFMESHPCIG
jgi:hypothetical protein